MCKKYWMLYLFVFFLIVSGFSTEIIAENSNRLPFRPCIHLMHNSQKYSLSYYGYKCEHKDFISLPISLYNSLNSWAFNVSETKILSEYNDYQIMARLATMDKRGHKWFNTDPCEWGPRAQYKWADHAIDGYLGIVDTLGHTPFVVSVFDKPLLQSGLVQKDKYTYISFDESHELSTKERLKLVKIFINAEVVLSAEKKLLIVPQTFENAVKEYPGYEEARKKNFTIFKYIP